MVVLLFEVLGVLIYDRVSLNRFVSFPGFRTYAVLEHITDQCAGKCDVKQVPLRVRDSPPEIVFYYPESLEKLLFVGFR